MLFDACIVDSLYVNWCVYCEQVVCTLVCVLWTVCMLIGACNLEYLYVNWCLYCELFLC